jgi:hypothetical protein
MDSLKILSPTYRITVTTSASNAVQLIPNTPTRAFRVALLNVGEDVAAVTFGTTAANVPTPAVAADEGSGSFVLAPTMFYPIVIDCGAPNVFVKAISAGDSDIFFTLVATE